MKTDKGKRFMKRVLTMFFSHFFADEGLYPAAGVPSAGYFILISTTFFCIITALNHTLQLSYEKIRRIIRWIVGVLWTLELIKIRYRFCYGNGENLNTWVPLYYCSITLFAGLLSALGHGVIQHVGDVFLCAGGLCGGICFLIYPATSLMSFPAWHFLSIHSFLYHGCMTYLGILLNRSGLVQLNWHDFGYYAFYVLFFCIIALRLNQRTGSNLMFISNPLPGTMYSTVALLLGELYTPAMILIQMTIPFMVIMWFKKNTNLLNRPAWYDGTFAVVHHHRHAL